MSTPDKASVESPAAPAPEGRAKMLAALLAGPIVFGLLVWLPIPLSYQGHIALATFAWAAVWWITQPVPWALAAALPIFVFPGAGVLDIVATSRLYGQPIFFWTMGAVLVGYAIEKHGLAHRVALAFLALPGVGGRTSRLTFAYLSVVGLVSMFVSDASTVAMMMPIGMSLARHVQTMADSPAGDDQETVQPNLAAFLTLGTLYASVAGGTATIMGVPHNAIAISLLARLAQRQLGFFEWMIIGMPLFVALLVASYVVLWVMTPPELRELPHGEAFLRHEREKLGPLRPAERRVFGVFVTMVVLFVLPTVATLLLGPRHPLAAWVTRAVPFWIVPPTAMVLLFLIPERRSSSRRLLNWSDAQQHAPWNTMILLAGAVGMTDALSEFGFVEFMKSLVSTSWNSPLVLPILVAGITAVTTNFISGTAATALYGSIFIPVAAQIGYSPASIAMLIANLGVGMALPWAGATTATAFAGGRIAMGRMVNIGIVATMVFALIVAMLHLLLSPLV
ncbi:MAG: SLC13 family permease [Vicinamibacterales bacterium]